MSMIENFTEFLVTELPALNIYCGGFPADSEDSATALADTNETAYINSNTEDQTVQVRTRSRNVNEARRNAGSIYAECLNRFGVTLPATTFDGETYPSVRVVLNPLQGPGYIGQDEAGRSEYVFNVLLTKGRQD